MISKMSVFIDNTYLYRHQNHDLVGMVSGSHSATRENIREFMQKHPLDHN